MDLRQRTASLTRSFAWGLASMLLLPCAAQLHAPPDPGISRMCLWNGDRHTWSELGLTKPQILKVEDIRKRYPAVVDGQWLDETVLRTVQQSPAYQQNAQDAVAAEPTGAAEQPKAPGTTTKELQAELRSVLSEQQLEQWQLLCAGPVTD